MYNVQNGPSPSRRLSNHPRANKISLLKLAATALILGIIIAFTTSTWVFNSPKPFAKAAAPLVRRIDIPYFNGAVQFNQTAVFWFGKVSSTDNYIDVRMGYNKTELYVDLHIVDRYLWYDPNAKAPNLTKGDTSTVYLSTTQNGGNAPSQASYKFVAQVDWYQPRTHYQAAFKGNGNAWVNSPTAFTAVSSWRGTGFNGKEDSGWTMTYHIPFSSLGGSGAPAQGTVWKLGVRVHNQDDAKNTPLPEKWWPETQNDTVPSSWGDLMFGFPTYKPPQTTNNTTYTVRNKLNNQVVTDGMVGGSLGCFNAGANRWTQLGGKAYPGATQVNIQNEWDISDWNCFSKLYISFPLNSLPNGKGVASAKVTLYEFGSAGHPGSANPSLIQVASVNEAWNPQTLSLNNAPLAKENISRTVVNTFSGKLVWPGHPYTWDVSRALADAYAAGQPLRLVFYSSDSAYSTGKYFTASSIGDWDATGRPTLQVSLGSITGSAQITTSASLIALTAHQQPAQARYSSDNARVSMSAGSYKHTLYLAPLLAMSTPLCCLPMLLSRKRLRKQR